MDEQRLDELINKNEDNTTYVAGMISDIVKSQTEKLDDIMIKIYDQISKDPNVPVEAVEQDYLELTNLVYFLGSGLSGTEIRATMAKKAAREVYNNAYLSAQVKDVSTGKSKTTVAECTSIAEKEALYESTVEEIYEHAYDQIKFKIDSAREMIHTLSKIISRKMLEMQNDSKVPNAAGIGRVDTVLL